MSCYFLLCMHACVQKYIQATSHPSESKHLQEFDEVLCTQIICSPISTYNIPAQSSAQETGCLRSRLLTT